MTSTSTESTPILPIPGFGWLEKYIGPYADRRIVLMGFFGFACGLPLALTASTLFAWLHQVGIDKKSIAVFAMIATPYSLKFLWAPIMDGTLVPFLGKLLGKRRGWLLVAQVMLIAATASMVYADPQTNTFLFGLVAMAIAFFSASQDIVVDAYRIERIERKLQTSALAFYNMGYRGAMLISGAGSLILTDRLQKDFGVSIPESWHYTYQVMAALMIVGVVATLLAREPDVNVEVTSTDKPSNYLAWFTDYVVNPFRDFMTRPGWLYIIAFVVLFRLADVYMGVMFNPFLLELGFTLTEIGAIVKVFGMFATIGGALVGGVLAMKLGLFRTLMICGFLHMVTNLLLVGQALIGKDEMFLAICVVSENATAGMMSMAFMAYLSSLCNVRYSATQYALLTSLTAVGRNFFTTTSGAAAEAMGWPIFFAFSSLLAIPALYLLWYIHKRYGMEEKA